MADNGDGSGFKVKDRRMFNPDGSPRTDLPGAVPEAVATAEPTPLIGHVPPKQAREVPGPQAPTERVEPARTEEDPRAARHQGSAPGEPGEIDFSQFVMSMAQIAAAYLGDIPNPQTGRPTLNLAAAKQQIDLLGMLETKTRGNLSVEERELLKAILTELRLRFVEVREAVSRAQPPRAR